MSVSKPRTASAPKPMCVVSVDFQYLMLPADKGMKLVELLQSAVRVEPEYRDRDYSYQVGDHSRALNTSRSRPLKCACPHPRQHRGERRIRHWAQTCF